MIVFTANDAWITKLKMTYFDVVFACTCVCQGTGETNALLEENLNSAQSTQCWFTVQQ